MRVRLGVLAALCAAFGLAGCGDKEKENDKPAGGAYGGTAAPPPTPAGPSSGVLGPWTIGLDEFIAFGVKQVKLQAEAELAAAPEEQREAIRASIPGDEKIREMITQKLLKASAVFEFKSDKTVIFSAEMPGEPTEVGTGTWSQDGSTISITPKMKNGKPTTGEDAEVKVLTLEGDRLLFTPEAGGPTLTFKRK